MNQINGLMFSTIFGLACIAWGPASAQVVDSASQIVVPSALTIICDSVEVPVEQTGVLVELNVKPGQRVAAGDLLARIKDETLLLKLERTRFEHELAKMAAGSRVDVEYSQKSHEVAVADLQRSTQANLRVANSIPEARVEKQRLEKDRTELKLKQARRDLTMAAFRTQITSNDIKAVQSEIKKTKIASPMSGLVVSVDKRLGEWVESSQSVCTIVGTDRLEIEGLLPASEAQKIRVGYRGKIQFKQEWIRPKEVPCRIVFISPEANPVNASLMVRAEFDNREVQIPAGIRADIIVDFPN